MADAATTGEPGQPLRTLADKVNWLIDRAHPAGRGPYSNAEVATLIHKVTGEEFSHTTIWKLRNGQATNPQLRLLQALARTFGVQPAFFFDDCDEQRTAQLRDQVELLALMRDAGVTTAQIRALATLPPAARQAITDLIEHTIQAEHKDRAQP